MKYFVYILECSDNSLYTGITWNLERRVKEHFKGASKYTRGRLPVKIVHSEIVADKIESAKREREIKSWPRKKKLELIKSLRR